MDPELRALLETAWEQHHEPDTDPPDVLAHPDDLLDPDDCLPF